MSCTSKSQFSIKVAILWAKTKRAMFIKGLSFLKIVSLKESILYIVKSRTEVLINEKWLKIETNEYILNVKETGFKVHAVIADHHFANVNNISHLLKRHSRDKKLDIYHLENNKLFKTYLFFDIVHVIKNIKKVVFPSFNFDKFEDLIDVSEGFAS